MLGSNLSPKTVKKIKKTVKVPIVCWCQDQLSTLGRQYVIGADYDKVFLKDLWPSSTEIKKVLYVEDNPANRRLMESVFIRLQNYQLTMFESAELAWHSAMEQDFVVS